MPAGSYEMRDYYPNQDPHRPTPHTAPTITPYLGLRARLSQVWLNRWTILLLLVLARTLIAIGGLNHDLASARREALSACSSVESVGSAMASMPHYMSQGVNELTASGVEKAVDGLMQMTTMTVTGVEEVAVFVFNMYVGTYMCLLTLVAEGGMALTVDALDGMNNFLNATVPAIGRTIGNVTSQFQTDVDAFVDKATSAINDVTSIFGGKPVAPAKLDLSTQIDKLNSLQMPPGLLDAANKVNSSIPNYDTVKNTTEKLIRDPFDLVKRLISQKVGSGYTFDRSLLPVPQKEQLTFCSDSNGINEFFDDLVKLSHTAKKIFIGVLVVAAILCCIPMAYREIRRWRTMQERSQLVRSSAYDPMDVVYIVSRPYTSTAGIKTANNFKSTRRQILTRWVFAYATSTPALFVLSLGIAGLFACACQEVMLKAIQKETPRLTNQVGAFADKVVFSLNNASEQWAISTNNVITNLNDEINHDMLGWVNVTTSSINSAINVMVDDMLSGLNATFGQTVLKDAIQKVLECLVIFKAEAVQHGLTWVQDHAHIDFPLLDNNTFSLGAAASLAQDGTDPTQSLLSGPGDQAADKISAAVLDLTNRLQDGIRTEALISMTVVGIYLFVVLCGIIRALTLWFCHEKTRGEGGQHDLYVQRPESVHDFNQHRGVSLETPRAAPPAPIQMTDKRPGTAGSMGPVPAYTSHAQPIVANPFRSPEDDYQDQKLCFAGERQLGVQQRPGHNRESSHGEVAYGYGHEKQ